MPWPPRGSGGARCKLDAAQLRVLEAVLDAGPAASGWSGQCWRLARIAEVVCRRVGVEYTLAGGLDLLLHRIDWSVQVPSRKATERDEARIAARRAEQRPVVKRGRRTWAPGTRFGAPEALQVAGRFHWWQGLCRTMRTCIAAHRAPRRRTSGRPARVVQPRPPGRQRCAPRRHGGRTGSGSGEDTRSSSTAVRPSRWLVKESKSFW
ncbi:winged helix-turn-helix domain-containing protein [Streptomyces sp. NPDC001928]|uniref:winged helix-turn-helix domain-containing protein n=1 Tax=Streptomyces sp. NPDC001928 TaxID=3154404 RepID=UPI00331A9009